MSTDGYLSFLLCGILLILIDGQILYRSGSRYLAKVYQSDVAHSVMQLVAVLFHLVVLGVLALISTIDVSTGLAIRDLVVKLGVVLLMLGVAHGVTMAILIAVRNRRREEQIIEDEMAAERAQDMASYPALNQRTGTVSPVND
jgi:Na+/serine symporter